VISRFKHTFLALIALVWLLVAGSYPVAAQERVHTVFFEGTDHELNVYRIYGQQPGKTILLIGGIQGDEPGGFLSVALYADISLAKGNLIVVPRANFHSIVLRRRQINEDMNRKFGASKKKGYETEVVAILKKLIAESDCLLNMHDGSGFFAETWVNPNRNPKKYGQSIIADADTYTSRQSNVKIELGEMAREVCRRMNIHIEDPDHFFRFNNHRTAEKNSQHKEQRGSATYYALTRYDIPAFGIETSKSLSLELKVLHHNLAVNAFMELLDVVPQTPRMNLEKPLLDYLVLSVNDTLPVVLKNQQTLRINQGDKVTISHIEANYERGLSADLVGLDTINDLRKPIAIRAPTRIVVRKDYYPCGSVYIDIGPPAPTATVAAAAPPAQAAQQSGPLFFKLKRNGITEYYNNYGRFKIIRGDIFEIVDVVTTLADPSDLVVNLKGFVGQRSQNTGEDRGYRINSGKDLWKRYSLKKKGRKYQVIVTLEDEEVGKLFIDLAEPEFKHAIFGFADGSLRCFIPGSTMDVSPDAPPQLVALATNINQNSGVRAYLSGPGVKPRRIKIKTPLFKDQALPRATPADNTYRLDVRRGKVSLGFININPSTELPQQQGRDVKRNPKDFSIIDKALTVDGTLTTQGRLVIKGTVKGALEGDTVVIAKEGSVYADTKVASMTIGGTFEGEIHASKELIILSTGNCSGHVECKDFVVEAGGVLNAQVTCIKSGDTKPNRFL